MNELYYYLGFEFLIAKIFTQIIGFRTAYVQKSWLKLFNFIKLFWKITLNLYKKSFWEAWAYKNLFVCCTELDCRADTVNWFPTNCIARRFFWPHVDDNVQLRKIRIKLHFQNKKIWHVKSNHGLHCWCNPSIDFLFRHTSIDHFLWRLLWDLP